MLRAEQRCFQVKDHGGDSAADSNRGNAEEPVELKGNVPDGNPDHRKDEEWHKCK